MQHGLDRFPIKTLCALHSQHHGSLSIAAFTRKSFTSRQYQMHARRAHPG
jgi:hypothetical protein